MNGCIVFEHAIEDTSALAYVMQKLCAEFKASFDYTGIMLNILNGDACALARALDFPWHSKRAFTITYYQFGEHVPNLQFNFILTDFSLAVAKKEIT